MKPLLYRSKLFADGGAPDGFAPAFASCADSVLLENEDHVPGPQKAKARADIAAFLADRGRLGNKVVQVRVNTVGSPDHDADLRAFVRPGVHAVTLPKVECPDQVRQVAAQMAILEAVAGVDEPIGLMLTIETPKGLRRIAEISQASQRVVGLQIGYGDLFKPYGIGHGGPSADTVRLLVKLAASEIGISCFDGAYGPADDLATFRTDTARAVEIGLTGKSCSTVAQAAIINELFPKRA
jgi:citrate lyase subunit beta/citryl-CoA lyase